MYENFDVKEKFINEVRTMMEPMLTAQQLDILSYVMSKVANHVNMTQKSDLPSLNVMNNEKLVQNFLISKKIEGLSERSLKVYGYTIKKMLFSLNMELTEIDSNALRYYLLEYNRTASNVTVNNARRNLNSFFSWLETEGYIQKNPMIRIKKIKCEKKIKTPLTTVEVQKIKDVCKNMREVALVDLMCSTGIRCEEITKITLNDINFETSTILIKGKGARQREVYLDDISKLHVEQYLSSQTKNSEYLFCNKKGDKLTTGSIASIVRNLGCRAGVKQCQVHRFRKYFATTLFKRGCDVVYVKQLLGHSKLDTTMIYVQTSNSRVREEFNHFVS